MNRPNSLPLQFQSHRQSNFLDTSVEDLGHIGTEMGNQCGTTGKIPRDHWALAEGRSSQMDTVAFDHLSAWQESICTARRRSSGTLKDGLWGGWQWVLFCIPRYRR